MKPWNSNFDTNLMPVAIFKEDFVMNKISFQIDSFINTIIITLKIQNH